MRATPFEAFVDDLDLLVAAIAPRIPRLVRRVAGATAGAAALAALLQLPTAALDELPVRASSASPLTDLPG